MATPDELSRHFELLSPGLYKVKEDPPARRLFFETVWFTRAFVLVLGTILVSACIVAREGSVLEKFLIIAFVVFGCLVVVQDLEIYIDSTARTFTRRGRVFGIATLRSRTRACAMKINWQYLSTESGMSRTRAISFTK